MIEAPEKLSETDLLKLIAQKDIYLQQKDFRIQTLQWELSQIKRMIFGSKSERFIPAAVPGQLSMDIEIEKSEEVVKETLLAVEAHERRKKEKDKKHPVRMPFPQQLPREIIELLPDGDLSGLVKIGEEVKEELELIEAKLFVRRIVRPKYARKNGEGALIAPLPACVIEKGLFGPKLIAQLLIDKYVDHLPVYRQMKRFERAGIKLAYSTLIDVPRQVAPLLLALYHLIEKEIMSCGYLQADETPHPVLDKDKGKIHRGYFWVYRSPEKRLVLFDYRPGRGREGPAQLLKNFKGFLQTDGYVVYDDFEKTDDIQLAGCMAHARRYFEKALDSDQQRAWYALNKIQLLYQAERTIREEQLTGDEVTRLRKKHALPVLAELEAWMKEQLIQAPPKSPMGEALAYSLSRWEKLTRYIHHPRLEIDNNLVENAIRPTVLGRKNYLFAGSHQAAQRSAMMYTFMGCCKINNINPQAWLADVLIRIADTKMSQLHTLLPGNWKPCGA